MTYWIIHQGKPWGKKMKVVTKCPTISEQRKKHLFIHAGPLRSKMEVLQWFNYHQTLGMYPSMRPAGYSKVGRWR